MDRADRQVLPGGWPMQGAAREGDSGRPLFGASMASILHSNPRASASGNAACIFALSFWSSSTDPRIQSVSLLLTVGPLLRTRICLMVNFLISTAVMLIDTLIMVGLAMAAI